MGYAEILPTINGGFGLNMVAGAKDYDLLDNKPQIESVTLQGNKTLKEIGVGDITEQDIDDMLFGIGKE